ncbi:hypothetical protein [Natronoglycomyces albus]|uniref:ATP-grasp domain-containing protein n=1 Tax=Natronoglycomyces albus TaxID=2811108 RepID=A0A895XM08_9ACTN|nr:hypothetical protein [Natronoglycomyces albus]QSB04812.1 hypothetical protein JQS30_13720 [Natronoglycomyces albus]
MTQLQATAPMPDYLHDGYQVHRAALAHGLNILALPRQVLLTGETTVVPSSMSFTHGVPEASTVSAVTFAHDRRLRRALLSRAGIPVPTGQTFSYRRLDRAIEWASGELGFPVVLKEMQGENPAEAVAGIASVEQFHAAVNTLRRRDATDRSPGSNPRVSGYATTRFGFELDDEGNQIAPAKSRILVEKHLEGEHVRVFACPGSDPIAVLLDPETGLGSADISESIDPSLHKAALQAVDSIPGLAVGSVDIVITDHRKPVDNQAWAVVDVSERIRSETYDEAAAGLGDRIGDALVAFQAGKARLTLAPAADAVEVRMRIEGLREPGKIAEQFATVASQFDVTGSAEVADDLEGLIDATAQGTPAGVARLTESLMAGLLLEDRAYCVETQTSN